MQTYSIKWNCSGNLAGVFVCKSSPRKRHNWRSAVGFLINAAFLNVYFILEYHLFFRKDFQFRIIIFHWIRYSNVFFFVFWLRGKPSIMYLHNWGNEGGSSKICTCAYRGRGVLRLMCTYALTLSLFILLSYAV